GPARLRVFGLGGVPGGQRRRHLGQRHRRQRPAPRGPEGVEELVDRRAQRLAHRGPQPRHAGGAVLGAHDEVHGPVGLDELGPGAHLVGHHVEVIAGGAHVLEAREDAGALDARVEQQVAGPVHERAVHEAHDGAGVGEGIQAGPRDGRSLSWAPAAAPRGGETGAAAPGRAGCGREGRWSGTTAGRRAERARA
ncbi:MAG: hypothetical protein ACK559_29455, partial [bacterium]